MCYKPQDFAAILMSFTDQSLPTSQTDQKMQECRVLAATIIRALKGGWNPNDISAWIRWRTRTAIRPHDRHNHQSIPMSDDELLMQLHDVQRVRKLAKSPRDTRSKVDPHRSELLRLRSNGGSWNDLKVWLRRYQRVNISRTALIERVPKWEKEIE